MFESARSPGYEMKGFVVVADNDWLAFLFRELGIKEGTYEVCLFYFEKIVYSFNSFDGLGYPGCAVFLLYCVNTSCKRNLTFECLYRYSKTA